jgi:DNA-binding transcriptional ArsR family regulator
VVVELEWALASGEREEYRDDHPILAAIYGRHPDLQGRVEAMWGPGEAMSCGGFLELMVLAHRGGLLFSTDAELLLERLDGLCAAPPEGELSLRLETPEDRAAVLRRLARLSDSSELRDTYVSLVRDMWDAIAVDWELSGRGAVEVAVAARRALVEKGADWHEVARSECAIGDMLDHAVAGLGPAGQIVVVPAFFTHKGLLVDLPGVVVAGVRVDTTGAHARARTEALARRLKAISDPTRLAILDALRSGPRTASEIAAAFSLAQPTVSNHVKLLRDAGLVTDVRNGTRRNLVVQGAVVEELIGSLHDVLSSHRSEAQHGEHGQLSATMAGDASLTSTMAGDASPM